MAQLPIFRSFPCVVYIDRGSFLCAVSGFDVGVGGKSLKNFVVILVKSYST